MAQARRNRRPLLQVDTRPLPVQADIDALGIALCDLIDNALKHGGDTAQMTVHFNGQTLRAGGR